MSRKKFYKGKLVRDNISKIMKAQGLTLHERTMNEEDYMHSLKEKLLEEALEVQNSLSPPELIEELADVFEVLYALIKSSGLTVQQVEEARLKKYHHKGGFESRTYLDTIEIEDTNPFIHQYKHKNLDPNCLFCKLGQEEQVLAHFKRCYVIKDGYPVSPGHVLIIPYEHTLNWFTASQEVKLDILHALTAMKRTLDEEFHPDGYNIGMNCGESAGQSIMHLHVHLIPRYKGDMSHPKGGVRGVIPSKQNY
jgi:diadenosine tetraphosphate (Ap4A) HIT family hydrolase/predicted house-cleaning noncanonical NTP pyrophosphatase (MazG superfamily)